MSPRAPLHVREGVAGPWHRCFAWLPVRTEQGYRVWLRRTWRRRFYAAGWFVIPSWWEYSDDRLGFWERGA